MAKMKNLLTLLLLSIPSLTFGQIEGKGLVCHIEGGYFKDIRGFLFKTGPFAGEEQKGWINFFHASEDEVFHFAHPIVGRTLTPEHIYIDVKNRFDNSSANFIFDRKSGKISGELFDETEGLCEVFASEEDYWAKIEQIENQYQAQYDMHRDGNKL
jgi:hypothetical protein